MNKNNKFKWEELVKIKQNLPYKEWIRDYYFKSSLWRKIKKNVLKRDNKVCRLCGEKGTYLYHMSYSDRVLRGFYNKKIITVCKECSLELHTKPNGERRSLFESNERILTLKEELRICSLLD